MKEIIFVLLIGYGFGLLQWSYFISKGIKKVDIRTLGQGNAGASNTVESFGIKYGVLVAVLDILKAYFSIILVKRIFNIEFVDNDAFLLYLNAFGVIIGHNFPFFMGFKGGKGTAALIGALFGFDLTLGIIGLFLIIGVSILSNYVILGTLFLTMFTIAIPIYYNLGLSSIVIAIIIAMLSFSLHIKNYKRIITGSESKVRTVLFKNKKANL
ncbi:MAG: glycerol-3-phosphate acyltransferase [Clostridium sp.]|nr:glycerol-3-phosphate acyltransferase [Clostridium sp.]